MDRRDYDILLSYGRSDATATSRLASVLRARGVRVWFDQWELIPGEAGEDQWRMALTTAGIICICLGSDDPHSVPMLAEALALRKKAKPPLLLPVRLPGASLDRLPPELAPAQTVELSDAFDAADVLSHLGDAILKAVASDRPPERLQTMTAMNNIAEALRTVGDSGRARSLHERVLSVRKEVLGKDHLDTLVSMNNLAGALLADGDPRRAQSLLEDALQAADALWTASHRRGFAGSAFGGGLRALGIGVPSSEEGLEDLRDLTQKLRGNLYATRATQAEPQRGDEALVPLAQQVLAGRRASFEEIRALVAGLKATGAWGFARRILDGARRNGLIPPDRRIWARNQHAICTYKDPDLPVDVRLENALGILGEEGEDLGHARDQETLGIAGTIYKHRWEWDGQEANLQRALAYYLRGHAAGPQEDYGYNGINAAHVLDILASIEEEAGGRELSAHTQNRRAQGREIRQNLIAILPALPQQRDHGWLEGQYWFWETLGEVAFGLGDVERSRGWLVRAARIAPIRSSERETTIRQLVSLLRHHADAEAKGPLRKVLTDFIAAYPDFDVLDAERTLDSVEFGKVGLALSGAGLRASLFHIGVLARLAELDLLRRVEVLSCVSGGSIIGAHYYLEVRRLLQEKADSTITQQDYVEIVERIERDFLAGVQRNLRTRVAANPVAGLKMLLLPGYTRTHRLGELYESELFRRVQDGEGGKPRWLDQLWIMPRGESPGFRPEKDNWRRYAKVPILTLNATTLNSGHNWQFTPSFMGESPSINSEVDGNARLRRLYYSEAPHEHRHVRLGYAVAASSCVPTLFEPLALKGLYPDRLVRLFDGAVGDSQGMSGLLERSCSVILVSDPGAPMEAEKDPATGMRALLSRSNSILQERMRGAQARETALRSQAPVKRGLMFVHLKKGLEGPLIDWLGCNDPTGPAEFWPLTSYGLRKDLQARLAGIRTDLDAFSDAEAFALMTSGYSMVRHELRPGSVPCIDARPSGTPGKAWTFLRVEKALTEAKGDPQLPRVPAILTVAAHPELKAWRLLKPLQVLGTALVLAVLASLVGLSATHWDRVSWPTVSTLGWAIVVLAILAPRTAAGLLRLATLPLTWIHLLVFDRLYLSYGRVRKQ